MSSSVSWLLKSAQYLVSPAGIIALFLILCLLASLFRWRITARVFALSAALTFWLSASPLSAHYLQYSYLQLVHKPEHAIQSNHPYDAVVVAGWQKAFTPDDPEMNKYTSVRLSTALQQSQQQSAPIVLVSSQYPIPEKAGPGERSFAENKLRSWGMPARMIENAKPGKTTYEAMHNAKDILQEMGARSIVVVGSRGRLARKSAVLRKLYADEHDIIVHEQIIGATMPPSSEQWMHVTNWFPNEKQFLATSSTMHEIVAYLAYKSFGWL